ncbi:hypothetical protein FO519_004047 [Halicephalobus sp. NKZ332]|nr:hypothetical protein FO519_004047 [Halicephalobus sp. NKZ332]
MTSSSSFHLVLLLILLGTAFCSTLPLEAFKDQQLHDSMREFDPALLNAFYRSYASRNTPFGSPLKRAGHQLESRSINQFKNCYFSPVQCVLLERRRR